MKRRTFTPGPLPPGWEAKSETLRAEREAEADAARPGMEAARRTELRDTADRMFADLNDKERAILKTRFAKQLTIPGSGPEPIAPPITNAAQKPATRKRGVKPKSVAALTPTGKKGSLRVYLRIGPKLLTELDAFIATRNGRLDRAKAVRRALRAWLDGKKEPTT